MWGGLSQDFPQKRAQQCLSGKRRFNILCWESGKARIASLGFQGKSTGVVGGIISVEMSAAEWNDHGAYCEKSRRDFHFPNQAQPTLCCFGGRHCMEKMRDKTSIYFSCSFRNGPIFCSHENVDRHFGKRHRRGIDPLRRPIMGETRRSGRAFERRAAHRCAEVQLRNTGKTIWRFLPPPSVAFSRTRHLSFRRETEKCRSARRSRPA